MIVESQFKSIKVPKGGTQEKYNSIYRKTPSTSNHQCQIKLDLIEYIEDISEAPQFQNNGSAFVNIQLP